MEKIRVENSPKVYLIGRWGSEELVAGLADVLYREVPLEEAIYNLRKEDIDKRISGFFRMGHWSVFELMGAQFW